MGDKSTKPTSAPRFYLTGRIVIANAKGGNFHNTEYRTTGKDEKAAWLAIKAHVTREGDKDMSPAKVEGKITPLVLIREGFTISVHPAIDGYSNCDICGMPEGHAKGCTNASVKRAIFSVAAFE